MNTFLQQLQQKKCFGKGAETIKVKPAIKKESAKRKVLNREYAKKSRPIWKGKLCKIKSPDCTGSAQGWNHAAGKETKEKLLDLVNGQPACNACNVYIERHHAWAVERGFITKRNLKAAKFK